MTELKATPGPWRESQVASDVMEIVGADYSTVCDLYFMDEHEIANCHLIAAAPELYEALDSCLFGYGASEGQTDLDDPNWRERARAALAKARGEQ